MRSAKFGRLSVDFSGFYIYNIIVLLFIKEGMFMKKLKLAQNQLMPLLALGLVIMCYAGEKALKRLTVWSETSALIQAFVFTLVCAAVFLIIMRFKDSYFGIITGIFAFKILPPDIEMLREMNIDAACVYFIVRKMALVLFLYAVYKLYAAQKKEERHIRTVPIAALFLVIPFVSGVSNDLEQYALIKTGSMMLPYALDAGSYIAACAVLALVCFVFRGKNAALVCDFSTVGFIIGGARKLCSIIIISLAGQHLSKSYICWVAIYAVLIAAFAAVRKKTAGSALLFGGEIG